MIELSRRRLLLSSATAGAAFGLGGALEILPSAWAQSGEKVSALNPKGLAFHKHKIGDIEAVQVFDGAVERNFTPEFVRNGSIEQTKAALRAAGLKDEKLPNSYTVTVVKIGDKQVMFDSGNGPGGGNPEVGHLAANMKAAGIDPSKLSAIVVTHFHPDHIYGLLTKENAQIYENVEIIVPESEYKYWADPATIEKLPESRRGIAKRVQATMPKWKNLKQHSGDKDVVAGIKAVQTPGHTPGHTSYLMGSGDKQFMVLGDITSIPPVNLRNPGWHVIFDQDAKVAEETRRRTLDRVIADKIVCAGYHWGMPGAGTIAKDGAGYVLVPIAT